MAAKPRSQAGTCCQRWNRFVAPVTCTCRFASLVISAGSFRAATGAPSLRIAASSVDDQEPTPNVERLQPGLVTLEQGDRLDMRRVRKHVDRPSAHQLVPVLPTQGLHV